MGTSPELARKLHQWDVWAENMRNTGTFLDVSTDVRGIVITIADTLRLLDDELDKTWSEFAPRLRQRVQEIQTQWNAMNGTVAELAATDDKLGRELSAATEKMDRGLAWARKQLENVQESTKLLSETVGRTHEKFEQLLRQFRALTSPEMKADVAAWAATQAERGQRAAEGREATRQLNAMDDQRLRAMIARSHEIDGDHRTCQGRAVDAARSLASLDPSTSGKRWRTHTRAWRENRDDTVRLANDKRTAEADKRFAEVELNALSTTQVELAAVAERGRQAEDELRGEIRAYLDWVFATDRILPKWFDVALGSAVPPTRAQKWLQTAVEVMRYRIVYKVDHSLLALGDTPADEARCAEYDQLTAQCAEYRL